MLLIVAGIQLILLTFAIAAAAFAMLVAKRSSLIAERALAVAAESGEGLLDERLEAICRQQFNACQNELKPTDSSLEALRANVERLVLRVAALEAASPLIEDENRRNSGTRSPVPTAINFSARSRALRMLRRGDPPELVAATLEMKTSEVRLLSKVHQLTSQTPSQPPLLGDTRRDGDGASILGFPPPNS